MARSVTPKVNRSVTYYDAAGVPHPGIITGGIVGTTVNLRIAHATTKAAVVLGNRDPASVRTNCWMVK